MSLNPLHPRNEDQENVICDYIKMAEGLQISEKLLQIMMEELHYEKPITYPNGQGDPNMDLKLLGNRPSTSLPKTVMESMNTPAPEAKVEVTKVAVEAPKLTEEFILKFCKAGKMLGLTPETVKKIAEELKLKLEEGSESPTVESTEPASHDVVEGEDMPTPTKKSNALADLLK